ncbi:unnamed protein product [Dibothriocephalus latus]|uniref:Uncharacterized protein n=1 Tax=Dibothriocephalus latus TaxID=60516 RepID=A0A3P6RMQ3_DIBLA|nr:unnamed protein product [Dibothriocephalus latus]
MFGALHSELFLPSTKPPHWPCRDEEIPIAECDPVGENGGPGDTQAGNVGAGRSCDAGGHLGGRGGAGMPVGFLGMYPLVSGGEPFPFQR